MRCRSKHTAWIKGGTTTTRLVLLFRIPSSLTFTAAPGQRWNQLSSYCSQLQPGELLHHCTMPVFAGGRLGLENKGGNLVAPKSNIMINEGVGREPGEQGQPYNLFQDQTDGQHPHYYRNKTKTKNSMNANQGTLRGDCKNHIMIA